MKSKLFQGIFNWYGELHTIYSHANNKSRALINMVHKLEDILPHDYKKLYPYFKFGNNKYEIKEVIKDD